MIASHAPWSEKSVRKTKALSEAGSGFMAIPRQVGACPSRSVGRSSANDVRRRGERNRADRLDEPRELAIRVGDDRTQLLVRDVDSNRGHPPAHFGLDHHPNAGKMRGTHVRVDVKLGDRDTGEQGGKLIALA